MDASKQFCPNPTCSARGQRGTGNIRIHSYQPQRYRCRTCKKTFIPIRVLRDRSKMREVGQGTEAFRLGFQLVKSFTDLVNHIIK